ncbi:MAG: type II toxin-antitoxin system PemK/MazF family toxin [Candidatus Pacearchaeota archaeon]
MSTMTNGTSSFNQREVVFTKVPYTNQIGYKIRPALILSRKEYNRNNQDYIVCYITLKPTKDPYKVKLDNKDLERGKLKASIIRPGKIFTILEKDLYKKAAKVKITKMKEVLEKLNSQIALDENE